MIEVAHNHISALGEGPLWDPTTNSIYWIDVLRGEVHQLAIMHSMIKTLSLNQSVGSIAVTTKGNLLMACQKGLVIYNRSTGEIKPIGKPIERMTNLRFNDGNCDPSGRFWVGTMSNDEVPGVGSLYQVDQDFKFTKSIDHLTIPNGMAWNKDGKIFYFIDTPAQNVTAYCFEKKSGKITDPKVIIAIAENDGAPDGMTIDNEGMLWVAHWNGWKLTRWNPVTGEKLLSLPMPVANVTSCTFGGKELSDLYITTARTGLTSKELQQQPLAGSLFVWKNCGYQGLPAHRFNEQ